MTDWTAADADDDLFPRCDQERLGTTFTDEYGVTYICDLVDGLGYAWVHLGRTDGQGSA